jgi:phosphoribosylformylglycinamidine cyclo-ligase
MAKEYDPTKPFNEQTRATIQETWRNARKWNMKIYWAGKRAVYQECLDPSCYKIDATDGIGTKALLHWLMYKHGGKNLYWAAQDAVAMVFDDLVEQGAAPYRVQDHIVMQEEDEKAIHDLTRGLADLCKVHGAVITGGETAICDTMRGFEMGITAVGIVENEHEPRASQVKKGDVIIGLRSSGIHSNGLTFARKVFDLGIEKSDLKIYRKFGPKYLGKMLTEPTTIYCKELLKLLEKDDSEQVHGLVHITGGGWTKLKELDPKKKFDFEVSGSEQPPHEIFKCLKYEGKLRDEEMYKKFNCGVGYMIAVDPDYAKDAMSILRRHSPKKIGSVIRGKGQIRIHSAFTGIEVVY